MRKGKARWEKKMGSNGSASHKLLMVGEEGTIIRTITCQGLKCPPTASAVHGKESIGWTGISEDGTLVIVISKQCRNENGSHHGHGSRLPHLRVRAAQPG